MNEQKTMKEKLLTGSAWMTAGSILSRILGAIYIIPWYSWFGENRLQANALYTKGYTVYSIFLMIAISGIPSAVAKQVAYYNSKNEYLISKRLFKVSFLVLFVIGVICTLIFWLIAPLISQGDPRVIPIYRSLALALLIIPTMSLLRGYFQGYQEMAPSALSQLLEQFIRIIYMLGATFITIKVLDKSYEVGVWQSTFAAFIGAIGGTLILVWYYLRHKQRLDRLAEQSAGNLVVSDLALIKEVSYQAMPFIFIACAMSTFNLIDQFSFPVIFKRLTTYTPEQINALYALFAGNANKIIMIVVALSTALATTAIPLLSEAVAKKERELTQKQLLSALELLFFIMLPAVLGMAAVSRPLYLVFYGYDELGIYILAVSAYMTLAMGLFNVLGSLLQGVYENGRAIRYTVLGLILKLLFQYPLTASFGSFGPILATGLAMMIASYYMLRYLYYRFDLQTRKLQFNVNLMALFSLVMFALVLLLVTLLTKLFPGNNRLLALSILVVTATCGAAFYLFMCLKAGIIRKILGEKIEVKLQKIFFIRKNSNEIR